MWRSPPGSGGGQPATMLSSNPLPRSPTAVASGSTWPAVPPITNPARYDSGEVMVSVGPQTTSMTSSVSSGTRWDRQYQCMPCWLPPSTMDWRNRYGRGRTWSAMGVPARRSGAIARRPAAGSPTQVRVSPRTGFP